MEPWMVVALSLSTGLVPLLLLLRWARRGLAPARAQLAEIADIAGVTTPRSFSGKSQAVRLLAVEWRTGEGTDQVAMRVPELDSWLDELDRAGVTVQRS